MSTIESLNLDDSTIFEDLGQTYYHTLNTGQNDKKDQFYELDMDEKFNENKFDVLNNYTSRSTTNDSTTSEDVNIQRIPKSGFLATRPGCIINYNNQADIMLKYSGPRKVDDYAAVTYIRDLNGRLVSTGIPYKPLNPSIKDDRLHSCCLNSITRYYTKPLRVFDKRGKPLTNKFGRPLLDIFGKPKVMINMDGRPVCNEQGDPVFNALGDSTVYEDTDSTIPPIGDEEPGIPIKDITGQEILFLYDNAGNPLTDLFGRPLLTSSGSSIFGINAKKSKINNIYKPLYGKNPIENIIRNIQIFDSNGNPLTDEEGVPLNKFSSDIICNDDGLPICDQYNKPLGFKYGKRLNLQRKIINEIHVNIHKTHETMHKVENNDCINRCKLSSHESSIVNTNKKDASSLIEKRKILSKQNRNNINLKQMLFKEIHNKKMYKTKESKHLYDRNHLKNNKHKSKSENDFLHHYKNSLQNKVSSTIYNEYGKPLIDCSENLLYDNFGIPLTGENGVRLNEKTRQILREKLLNIPILNPKDYDPDFKILSESTFFDDFDQFGRPNFDKWGRPLYDLYGKLIYDSFGRPLTDAFDRPLTDSIGQPFLDKDGRILTARIYLKKSFMIDIFGRPTHDRQGNALFDVYGRPKYDIYTNSIYDDYGRPVSDANGIILKDAKGNSFEPFPNKPLYKNSHKLLSFHIDKLYSIPVLNKFLMWKYKNLVDPFGGPLFDDYGHPMYSKAGKPLFDKYGRPLYDKKGKPLCDSYGRPLSEEIRPNPPIDTLSVIDSLKLLRLTDDTLKWMEVNEQQLKLLSKNPEKIIPHSHGGKSDKSITALTRITVFPDDKRFMEILEAPISASTSMDMHRFPFDSKSIVMKELKKESKL
uniref:Uncharacterized protein n=1 Tax=Clastoptera arizonana TaxID=38151 RepID=A0A1B6CDS2_9HEMI